MPGRPWNKGLTKSDSRVAQYAAKLTGRTVSVETRAKLSALKTMKPWFTVCQECGRGKGRSPRPRCNRCAARFRAATYPGSMTGKTLSPEHKAALHGGISRMKQTKPEAAVQSILRAMFTPHEPFRYSGDRGFWIRLHDRYRNPDFTNRAARQVIEVFGRYWHRPEEEARAVAEYAAAGWACLVIWDDAIDINTRDRIMQFAYPFDYEDELRETRAA